MECSAADEGRCQTPSHAHKEEPECPADDRWGGYFRAGIFGGHGGQLMEGDCRRATDAGEY